RRSGCSTSSASWKTVQASSGNSSSSAKAISSTSSRVAGRRVQTPSAAVTSAAERALARGGLRGVGLAQVHRLGAREVLAADGEGGGGQQQVPGVDVLELDGRGQQLGVERGAGADEQVAGGQLGGDLGGGV